MEMIICVVLILVLWEVRELRNERKVKEVHASISDVAKRAAESVAAVRASFDDLKAQAEESRQFAQSTDSKLDVILKEYELNGVPLGYARKQHADFVEGL